MTVEGAHYWDAVAAAWQEKGQERLWRIHSDAVNGALLTRWLPTRLVGRVLKTDLFDEAVGDGVYSLLASRAETVVGMDLSPLPVRAAESKYRHLRAVVGDVRSLPFRDGAIDAVVSVSTLDHLGTRSEILMGLREAHRVLRRGGRLLLTLDNPGNPAIALRNALPFPLLQRLGVVPYYVGPTCGARDLRRLLREAGFDVREVTAVMHCPRLFAVAIARVLENRSSPGTQSRFLAILASMERLSAWPTRFLTGHFVAVNAVKP